jgi:ArsR family metal-binding transcriptional regulator
VEWIKREINDAWEKREEIEPCYEGLPKPKLIEILKLLPKTNCRKCDFPTCMVFAAQVIDGGLGVDHCPELVDENRSKLSGYLEGFVFE